MAPAFASLRPLAAALVTQCGILLCVLRMMDTATHRATLHSAHVQAVFVDGGTLSNFPIELFHRKEVRAALPLLLLQPPLPRVWL